MVKAEQAPGAKTSAESGSEWQEEGHSLEIAVLATMLNGNVKAKCGRSISRWSEAK